MLAQQIEKKKNLNSLNIPELEFIVIQVFDGYVCSNGVSQPFKSDDKIKALSFCYQANKLKKQLDLLKQNYNLSDNKIKEVLGVM